MCTSCDPEPVDEQPPAVAETRGGNQLADITVPEFATGGIVQPPLPFPDDDLGAGCGSSICDCGTE